MLGFLYCSGGGYHQDNVKLLNLYVPVPKSPRTVTAAMKLKDVCFLNEKL